MPKVVIKNSLSLKKRQGFIGIIIAIVVVIILIILVFVGAAAFVGDRQGANSNGQMIDGNSGGAGGCTDGKLSQTDLNTINQNKAVYQAAAAKAGIPWELLASLHYRETTLSTASTNPFQHGNLTFTSFQAAADDAASFVKTMAKNVYGVNLTTNSSGDDIKKAALAYNRGSYFKMGSCSIDSSPYVMNQFDTAHQNMSWTSCDLTATKGKLPSNDGKAGAFTVFSILTGAITGASTCSQTVTSGNASGLGCNNVPLFVQGSPPWGSQQYGSCSGKSTVGSSGCGVSAAAMVLKFYGKNVDPGIMAQQSASNGYRACGAGTSYSFFPFIAKQYGLKDVNSILWSQAVQYLKQGKPVIAAGSGPVPFSSGGHYIVLTCYNSDGTISVDDSAGGHHPGVASYPATLIQNNQHFLTVISN